MGLLPYWVVVNDKEVEGEWVWPRGDALSYEPWAPGEPNDYGDGEDCAAFNWNGRERWNDVVCGNAHGFVCEIKSTSHR